MREHSTYRAVRRNEARIIARETGIHISQVFRSMMSMPSKKTRKAKKKAD